MKLLDEADSITLKQGCPLKGRIVPMLPGVQMPSGRPGCTVCTTQEECEALAQEACDAQVLLCCFVVPNDLVSKELLAALYA